MLVDRSCLDLVDLLLDIMLNILSDLGECLLLGSVGHENSRNLDDADQTEEEVDGSEPISPTDVS